MAVAQDGEAVGSVSGGCVEGAVYELCHEVMETGVAVRESFGYCGDTAFAVGLTCGGTIEVFVQPAPSPQVVEAAFDASPVAVARLLDGAGATLAVWPERVHGTTGLADLDAEVVGHARAMPDLGTTGIRSARCRPGKHVFIQSCATKPRLLICGAIDYVAAVATLGKLLGFQVTICDARPLFATRARFPDADEIVVDWPPRYLSPSRPDRKGTGAPALAHRSRPRCPHPEETAVAIAAELVAEHRGGTALPLTQTNGPIHHGHTASVAVA
ncbi:XdhC family protein [Streptomyces spinoverrucosus]|uniref:XdhC family protein n=1 Tax=Streptomyces spinoverrucosus TaxID=284043 RepID=UPI0018C3F7C5|nr:XdhC family protein [Streptomyces spinoverrucosus]